MLRTALLTNSVIYMSAKLRLASVKTGMVIDPAESQGKLTWLNGCKMH